MSIDLKKTPPGTYVVVSLAFHDYGKVGNVFRIIDCNIPGEPTAAVGWLIDRETGDTVPPHSYRIPCDKVDILSRTELASILKKGLQKLQKKVSQAKAEYEVLHNRVTMLESYYSRDRELEELLGEMFSFIK